MIKVQEWNDLQIVLLGGGIGAALTFCAGVLAFISAGGGHGDYFWAKVCFPYSMLLTIVQRDTITLPLVILAFVQFPLYGMTIGALYLRGFGIVQSLACLGGVHGVSLLLCLACDMKNFK